MKNKFAYYIFFISLFLFLPIFSAHAGQNSVLEIPVAKQTEDKKISMTIKTIFLGMDKEEVRGILGEPDSTGFEECVWYYAANKAYIRFDKFNKVISGQKDYVAKCPVCGRPMKILPIVYGDISPERMKLIENNEIISGGRYSTEASPLWGFRCTECDKNFSVNDPTTRIHLEIEQSLKYRPPREGTGKIKEPKPFMDQLKVDRGQEE